MIKYLALIAVFVVAVYGSGVVPYANPLGATLLPKINVAPAKVTIVKQPVTIQQTETVYRSVPVPVRAVAYTNPQIITPIVAQKAILTAPQPWLATRTGLW